MLLPGVVSWLPVPQPPVAVETFDIVTVACQGKQGQCEKRLQETPKQNNEKEQTKNKTKQNAVNQSSDIQ